MLRASGNEQPRIVRRGAERWGTRRMIADGFVAAQFPHRTSRLGDPHLHWHVLVANMARGIDGRWSALDGTALYRPQRTVGVLFQTAMRRELTAALGVEWGPMREDCGRDRRHPQRGCCASSPAVTNRSPNGSTPPVESVPRRPPTPSSRPAPVQAGAGDFATVEAGWRARAERARLGTGATRAAPRVRRPGAWPRRGTSSRTRQVAGRESAA